MDQICAVPICIAQQFGLVDAKGMPVMANITVQIQAMSPPNKVSDLSTAISGCIDKHSAKVDMTKCSTYSELLKCVLADVSKVCEWKPLKM